MEFTALTVALPLIGLVLFFEFSNGFNDSASMVVTPVITGAMEPRRALLLIALFEFAGAWLLGTAVAQTIGKGFVNPRNITLAVIFAAVISATLWNMGSWYFGMPSSSSHALVGGLVGGVFADAGPGWIHWAKVAEVLAILILTPLAALMFGRYLTRNVILLLSGIKPYRANRWLKRLEVLTSIALAVTHGSNDAQKGMGMIGLALLLSYRIAPGEMGKIYQPHPEGFYVPWWVTLVCAAALALGVGSGGWRIMKTLGTKLYKIRPVHGFSAQASSSAIIYASSLLGFPVSTTPIVSSSILGAGSAQGYGAVRWGVGRQIFLTWIITIPGSAVLSALLYVLIGRFLR